MVNREDLKKAALYGIVFVGGMGFDRYMLEPVAEGVANLGRYIRDTPKRIAEKRAREKAQRMEEQAQYVIETLEKRGLVVSREEIGKKK